MDWSVDGRDLIRGPRAVHQARKKKGMSGRGKGGIKDARLIMFVLCVVMCLNRNPKDQAQSWSSAVLISSLIHVKNM